MTGIAIDRNLLGRLLRIERPWEIREYQFRPVSQRLDVWVGTQHEQHGWLGFGRKQSAQEVERGTWQQVNLGDWRCYMHVLAPADFDVDDLPWIHSLKLPLSKALSRQVFALFNEGVSLDAICAITGIPLDDIWKFKFSLDHGRVRIGARAMTALGASAMPAPAVSEPAVAGAVGAGEVPDVADPVWLQLLEGRREIDIRVLSLKLLLTRLRSQMQLIDDDEVRMLKLREIHRYFEKNARMLGHELTQMRLH